VTGESRYLFVYGTLMAAADHPMGRRLGREARLIGPATIRGRLYDLGRYPALIESGTEDGLVHGEVHELASPASSLRWLDAYEGIVPGREAPYERLLRPVDLAAGARLEAWVYLYRRDVHRARHLESGRWLAPRP
jgi:gamma-glutamylcyclotransferase (GGCT)/AIG2-like uncharacterized protein YtfP